MLVGSLGTAHRGQPLPQSSPQAILESARFVEDRGRERASLGWRLGFLGRQWSGQGAVARSREGALLELHGVMGVVELRLLTDGEQLAVAVPATRTQYVGDQARWAWQAVTGDQASLLHWLAVALDRPQLPSSSPSEVRSMGDLLEVVWTSPGRRVVLDRQGRVVGVEWVDVAGVAQVKVSYGGYDLQGRAREVSIDYGPGSEELTLFIDAWEALPEDVDIPAPDAVPEGLIRRPLEQLGSSLWEPLGLTDGGGRLEP